MEGEQSIILIWCKRHKELHVISVTLIADIVGLQDLLKTTEIDAKQQWPTHRTLRNSMIEFNKIRFGTTDDHSNMI